MKEGVRERERMREVCSINNTNINILSGRTENGDGGGRRGRGGGGGKRIKEVCFVDNMKINTMTG